MLLLDEPFTSYDAYLRWAATRPAEEQYEVVDGVPVMTPSPGGHHQLVLARLARRIADALPDGYDVLPAPWDWVLQEGTLLRVRQPDLVVVRREQVERSLRGVPLLAVEVLSPSSFERDAVRKREEYAQAGLKHYWLVDPDTPQVAVFRRTSETLDVVAHVAGDGQLSVTEPFDIQLRPSDLIA